MNPVSRNLFLAAIILLIVPLFSPIWQIYIEAPQYPEPLGMNIYVDNIKGLQENDLENINLLNHYIGMKTIVPESIPELKLMKPVIYIFIALGILFYFINKKWLLFLWTLVLTTSAFVALYDFYLWEKDYGTNLNPLAPIKIENMTYIPPLIGKKQLLNITATSLPAIGGIVFILSMLFAWSAIIINFFNGHQANNNLSKTYNPNFSFPSSNPINKDKNLKEITLFLIIAFLTSCSLEVEPINYNNDECFLCKMLISDERFGGEIITKKGKIYKFDSIECMIEFYNSEENKNETEKLFTVDYSVPKKLINAKSAVYLHTDEISSPMGANILSFESENIREEYFKKYKGEKLSFDEVVKKISEESE